MLMLSFLLASTMGGRTFQIPFDELVTDLKAGLPVFHDGQRSRSLCVSSLQHSPDVFILGDPFYRSFLVVCVGPVCVRCVPVYQLTMASLRHDLRDETKPTLSVALRSGLDPRNQQTGKPNEAPPCELDSEDVGQTVRFEAKGRKCVLRLWGSEGHTHKD